ncbi:DsbA family protein, partial [Hyphomonas sp.]|uniref:DsbA family protein n=1 Tax=Hyphomonas sp. TaxID=87 RepID=UPI00391A4D2F
MTRHVSTAAILAALALFVILPACSQGGGSNRADMEKVVRDYILANPELIEEALVALEKKAEDEKRQNRVSMIAENSERLFNLASDFSVGPADAPITVVEFFDYRCGWCKRSAAWVAGLPELYDGQVRVVFKEFPIFGGISDTAARAALAAGRQGKYVEFHLALMEITSNDDLMDAAIDGIARSLGMDVARMRRDMESPEVRRQLTDMSVLGRT